MRHRSVAGAGRELNITPSAVSHALGRLRQLLDDPLFTLTETGMAPTPRALELAPTINEGLRRFTEAIETREFDPARSARTFRIAMSDYAAMILLPLIVDRVGRTGPNINLRIFPFSRLDLVANPVARSKWPSDGSETFQSECGACPSLSNPKPWWSVPAIR